MKLTTTLFPVHDHAATGYLHDPRCMGDCGPCGGAGGVPDTGPNGEMAMTCLTCGGSGRCLYCNLYLLDTLKPLLWLPGCAALDTEEGT